MQYEKWAYLRASNQHWKMYTATSILTVFNIIIIHSDEYISDYYVL